MPPQLHSHSNISATCQTKFREEKRRGEEGRGEGEEGEEGEGIGGRRIL